MKLIILAAGYATRLYPLTLTQPKPLLEVAGKPMLEHVIDNLAAIPHIDHAHIVTNAKFGEHFQDWATNYRHPKLHFDFNIVNDESTDDSNKLGAIGDTHLVVTKHELDDDIIVVGGDNLFSDDLSGFGEFCKEKNAPVLGVYDVGDLEEIKKYNAIDVDGAGQITFFQEKPAKPKSTLTGIALYYYPRHVIPMIHQYIAEGNNPDQPGRLVQWMYTRVPFYTWKVPGIWFDVGSKETLDKANEVFSQLKRAGSSSDLGGGKPPV
jgi:glucose-1-phosphate thymidylyltransferase